MGLDNPEPGSAFGSVASTLAKITGYGLSAAGIPIGPMLLGGTGMYDAHVERGRQGKTIEYLTSMYPDAPELPILRQMATSGTLDTRSAMEYLASGRARRAYGAMGKVMEPVNRTAAIPSFSPESFAGASPSDVVPGERQRYDASEFYQDVPTTTERFTRAGGMNLPPDVTAKVYELLMGHQGRAEPNVPADIQRRQAAGSYGRALEETGVKPEAAAIGAEAWSRDGTVKMPDRRDAAAQQLADELAAGTWDVATAKGRLGYQTRAAQLRTPPAALATNFPALRQEAETERLKTELLPQFQQRAQQIQSDPKLPEAYKRAVGWAMDQFEANPTEKAAVEVRRAIAQQDQAMARAEQSNARLQLARERIDRAIGDKDARRGEQLAISEQTRIQAQLRALRVRTEITNPDPVDRATAAHEYTQLEEQWYRLNEFLQRRIFQTPGGGEGETPPSGRGGGGTRAPGGTRYRMTPDGKMQRMPAVGVEG